MTADQNLRDHRGHFLSGLSSEQMGRGCIGAACHGSSAPDGKRQKPDCVKLGSGWMRIGCERVK